jgi:secreted trypsin-like serine protease
MPENFPRVIDQVFHTNRQALRAARWRKFLIRLSTAAVSGAMLTGFAAPAQAIYNGSPADADEFQYIVKVHTSFSNGAQILCTGSLIASDAVLTAAHCIRHTPLNPAGTSVTFHADTPADAYSVNVTEAVVNPGFDVTKYKDDVAVLRLDRRVDEPVIRLATTAPAVGSRVVFRGYGCTSDPYKYEKLCSAPARTLREMATDVVPTRQCPTVGGAWDFCTYTNKQSVNIGDSGGPVVQKGKDGSRLVGLVEAFEDPPPARWRDVSTSVAYHLSWIKETAGL